MIVHAGYPVGETRVQREAEALVQRGFEVDVICLRGTDNPPQEVYNQVHIYRLPVRRRSWRGFAGQMLEYLAFFAMVMFKLSTSWLKRYHTIQVHNLPDFLVFATWLPKLFGAKVILDLHDLMPEFFMARTGVGSDSLQAKLVYLEESLSCRFADHVITVSDHWRETLIYRGVSPSKCSVVMNLADERIFHRPPKGSDNSSLACGLDDNHLRMLYHGTVTYRYGLDLVIRAMAQVRAEIPNIHFAIVGGGDDGYIADLHQLVADLQLDGSVTFKHLVPVEELPGLIMNADLGIVAYRDDVFTNGLVPTKLMEYAAMELPAIASYTAAIRSYFEDTMVEFFTPGDVQDLARCMLRLHRDRSRLVELARNAARFNQSYNWTTQSAGYGALIERLAGR